MTVHIWRQWWYQYSSVVLEVTTAWSDFPGQVLDVWFQRGRLSVLEFQDDLYPPLLNSHPRIMHFAYSDWFTQSWLSMKQFSYQKNNSLCTFDYSSKLLLMSSHYKKILIAVHFLYRYRLSFLSCFWFI